MTTPEIDNVIQAIVGQPSTEPKIRWYRCPECHHVFEHQAETLPPAACPACQRAVVFRIHPTKERAEEAARASEKSAPAPAPAPTAEKPAKAKPVKAKPAPITEPAPVSPAVIAAAQQVADPRAERKARIDRFIAENKLNGISVTPVGTGIIDSIGFTRWVEKDGRRLPVVCFMEATDTPESFKAEFRAAQQADSTVKLDAARLCNLSESLLPVAFNGEIVASMYDPVKGHIRARIGDTVEIGARMSKSGTVIFQLLEVKR